MADTHNDEIDLKEVFTTIRRYKISIFFITLIFFIGSAIFAYYKPNIYSSYSSVEILEDDSTRATSADFMLKAFGGNTANIENEIAVINSRFIIQNALESLNLTTRYYSFNKINKKTELYKNIPFVVDIIALEDSIYYKNFILVPIDNEKFKLIIKPLSQFSMKSILAQAGVKPLEEEDKIQYEKVHSYGETISTEWFTIRIGKLFEMKAVEYKFNFLYKDDLYDTYSSGLSVSQISEMASVLDISYQDTVSLRAKDILNAITNTYIYENVLQKTKTAELTLGFIDSQLSNINQKLSKSENNLEKYKVNHDVINLSGKVAIATEKVTEYESQQLALQTEINILTNLQHFMNSKENLSGLTVGTIKFADKNLANLVNDLHILTKKKEDLSIDYTNLHPEMIKLSRSISSLKTTIKLVLENSLNNLKQRKIDLGKMIKKYNVSLNSLPSQEKELAELSRPLKVNQKIYEYLLQKKAETAILKSSTIAQARILDAARNDSLPIKPKRKLIIIVGLILGLIIGIALAFLREFMNYTVKNAEEVEKITSLPIYGVVPLNKNKLSKNIFDEAFRSIRTNLQFLPGSENNRIISITSSVSGEGKTTITAALSKVLAQSDKKVIVLDLDMRKASLHKEFNLNNKIGMSNYLRLENRLEEVIKQTDTFGLDIITVGDLPSNPSELILSSMFTNLLDELRRKYDYVVIDTPPAGLVTDATIIMNYADISFAIVRADYTRKEFVKNISKMAEEHSTNKMGIILNAADIGSKYGYGYGASYAHGYGNTQYYKDR